MKVICKAVALAVFVAAMAASAAAETLDFRFSLDRKAARAWEAQSGRWVVKEGAYRDVSAYAAILSSSVLKDRSFRNLSVRFGGDLVAPTSQLGTIIRAKLMPGGKIDGYLAIATFYPDSLINFEIYRLRDYSLSDSSGEAVLLCAQSLTATQNRLVGVSGEGASLSVTYDGKPMCSAVDKSYKKGQVVVVANFNTPRPGFTRVKIVSP